MNKRIFFAIVISAMSGSAFALTSAECDSLAAGYNVKISDLRTLELGALAGTTSLTEQETIKAYYDAQIASLIQERDNTLIAAGCPVGGVSSNPTPTPTPVVNPTPTPVPTNNGGGDTGGDVGGTPGGQDNCKAVKDNFERELDSLPEGRGNSARTKYIKSHWAEIRAACGNDYRNYGDFRSDYGGVNGKCPTGHQDDHTQTPQGDRDDHSVSRGDDHRVGGDDDHGRGDHGHGHGH